MAAPRVHSFLPETLEVALRYALGEEIELRNAGGEPVQAAAEAIRDDRCIAFVGPLLSWQVADTAAMLNEAGIAQLAVAATYAALTRDEPGAEDGMPGSLFPTGERTLFRLVPRDTAICRALAGHVGGRAQLIADGGDYGRQLAAQLRMAGLQEDADAGAVIYAGLAKNAPQERLRALAARPLYAFEGASEDGFPAAAGDHVRYVLAQRGAEGWPAADALQYAPQVKEAGMLIFGSALAGGADRAGVVDGLRACGRFDEYGDTRERRVGIWRWHEGQLAPDGFIEDPG